jgi:hypothetical protein
MWRVAGFRGTPAVCGIYRTAEGLEVHCYYGESVQSLVRSERAGNIDIARDIAAAWKCAALNNGLRDMEGGR